MKSKTSGAVHFCSISSAWRTQLISSCAQLVRNLFKPNDTHGQGWCCLMETVVVLNWEAFR